MESDDACINVMSIIQEILAHVVFYLKHERGIPHDIVHLILHHIPVERQPKLHLVARRAYCWLYFKDYVPNVLWLQKFMQNTPHSQNCDKACCSPRGWYTHRERKKCRDEVLQESLVLDIWQCLWEHGRRFSEAGKGGNWRHQFLLFEPHNSRPDKVEKHLRTILGDANFDRFIRIRLLKSSPDHMQIFIFGPGIDIDTVMNSEKFYARMYHVLFDKHMARVNMPWLCSVDSNKMPWHRCVEITTERWW